VEAEKKKSKTKKKTTLKKRGARAKNHVPGFLKKKGIQTKKKSRKEKGRLQEKKKKGSPKREKTSHRGERRIPLRGEYRRQEEKKNVP